MSKFVISANEKKALAVATVIALLGGAYFLRDYFILIAFAAVLAFMFNPVYRYLLGKGQKPGSASMLALIIALLTLIIPMLLVLAISIRQIELLVDSINVSSINDFETQVINTVNDVLSSLGLSTQLDAGSITTTLSESLKSLGQSILAALPSIFSGFFGFFSTAIIFLFVFVSLLKNQTTLIKTARALNPLGHEIGQLYIEKIAAMTKAMVRGQFIIATAQGFTDAALLALAGLPGLFFFFFVTLTALSIIPLGGGIVAIPIGIIMALTGNFWGGLLVIAGHILIVTNIDNVLRPRLVPKEAKLDSALTLLSVFAGLKLFGFLGIVIGPVLMILIVTTIRVYLDVYEGVAFKELGNSAGSLIDRTGKRLHRLFKRG